MLDSPYFDRCICYGAGCGGTLVPGKFTQRCTQCPSNSAPSPAPEDSTRIAFLTATAFFYEHAGWSFNLALESSEQGRRNCAERLAIAELSAAAAGFSFEWRVDVDYDEPNTYVCIMRDAAGAVQGSLGGIETTSDGPYKDPYRRVVQADMAAVTLWSVHDC